MDYGKLQRTAHKLIGDAGMSMVFVRRERAPGLPTPGLGYSYTETEYVFRGVKSRPTQQEVELGVFVGTDMLVLIPGGVLPGRPGTEDELRFDGKRWSISRVNIVAPATVDVLYKVAVVERANASV